MDEININNNLTITEHHNISELVESINRNIYNFHKVVHKLQQNYKTNKLNITKLTNDNKIINDMLFNFDNNINKKIEDIRLEINNIKSILAQIEKDNINNTKKFNDNLIYLFCANVLTTSVICFSFARIF